MKMESLAISTALVQMGKGKKGGGGEVWQNRRKKEKRKLKQTIGISF